MRSQWDLVIIDEAHKKSAAGAAKNIFTRCNVHTASFQIDDEEFDFYDALTRYVEDQSIKAAQDDSARGRALGFTMAMLQRRFASSTYAIRRSLKAALADEDGENGGPGAAQQALAFGLEDDLASGHLLDA